MKREGTTRRQFLRGTGGAVVGGAFLYGSSRSTRAQSGETWPQFGYDASNRGTVSTTDAPVRDVSLSWRYDEGINNNSSGMSIVVGNQRVYAGTYTGLRAVSKSDGSFEWQADLNSYVGTSSPAIANGSIYVVTGLASSSNYVYSIEANTGSTNWETRINSLGTPTPTVHNGTVYVTGGAHAYAIASNDGTIRWQWDRQDEDLVATPAVANSSVFISSDNGVVYALNTASGEQRWQFDTGEELYATPSVYDGTVIFGTDGSNSLSETANHRVYALSTDDGNELWHFGTDEAVTQSPAIGNKSVYVTADTYAYALSRNEGTKKWSVKTSRTSLSAPAVTDSGIYAVTDGGVVALSPDSGNELALLMQVVDRLKSFTDSGFECISSWAVVDESAEIECSKMVRELVLGQASTA